MALPRLELEIGTDVLLLETGDALLLEGVVGVEIDGVIVDIRKGSLMVGLRIEERGTASFTIIDLDGTANFPRGTPVNIFSLDGTHDFGGFIDKPKQILIAPEGGLYHDIVCMDNHYLADKRLIVKVYTSTLAGDIFKNIVDDYLAAEGVTYTADSIEDGPTIDEAVLNYVNASKAFNEITELAGNYTWWIDENKVLYFVERSSILAPWALDSDNRPVSTSLSGGNPLYRNRQYIKGGKGVTGVQVETFTADDDTEAFTVGYPIAQKPVITVDGTPIDPAQIGIKGIDTGLTCYWNKGDATITFATAPSAPDVIIITYYGQYPLISLATDEAERIIRQGIEGGTGMVEEVDFEAWHDTGAEAETSARAKLTHFCQGAEKFRFAIRKSGLKPGQLLTVTFSPYGFTSHEMLIESVDISPVGTDIVYTVVAITGPAMGSWTKFFGRLFERQTNSIRIGDQLLLVLLQQEETLELTEAPTRNEDDFSSGEVGRWIALPPAQGEPHHVQHEMVKVTEAPTRWEQAKGEYCWAPKTNGAGLREAVWDFFTWG